MRATWVHSSLSIVDLDRGLEFYVEAFDAEVLFSETLSAEIAATTAIKGMRCRLAQVRFPASDHVLELIEFRPEPGDEEKPPTAVGHGHVAFQIDDLDVALGRVEALGAVRVGEVVSFPEGRAIYMREPAGSVFELTEIDPDAVAVD